MAIIIVKLKIMPESPETNLEALEIKIKEKISAFDADFAKTEIEEIAFGLKALIIFFTREESKGSIDKLEEDIRSLNEVNSAEVIDVRKAIG